MDNKKRFLYVDLATKLAEPKLHADLEPYVGGLGFALKISADLKDRNNRSNTLIIATGPLSGFFPGCDRAVAYFRGNKRYIDGSFPVELKRAGYYGLSVYNTLDKPYYLVIDGQGTRFADASLLSTLSHSEKLKWLREHEVKSGSVLIMTDEFAAISNLIAIVVNSVKNLAVPNSDLLQKTLQGLWGEDQILSVSSEQTRWSDSWKSSDFTKRQILLDALVANEQTADIYGQIPVAFACLEAVGETRTHEEIEKLSNLYKELV